MENIHFILGLQIPFVQIAANRVKFRTYLSRLLTDRAQSANFLNSYPKDYKPKMN